MSAKQQIIYHFNRTIRSTRVKSVAVWPRGLKGCFYGDHVIMIVCLGSTPILISLRCCVLG